MLSSLSPVCHNLPLMLYRSSKPSEDVHVPGKYVQYLPSRQRDGIRLIYNQYSKKSGVILNDNDEYGKIVQIVLFLNALSQKPDPLPSIIICPKQRICHWKFNLHVWSKNNSVISIVDQDEVEDIVDHKYCCYWDTVVIDDINPSIVENIMGQMKCRFKIWNINENLWDNLPLLHTIGSLLGIIDSSLDKKMFIRNFSYLNKPYHEAVRDLQLLHKMTEMWLIRRRGDKPDFIKPSVYNNYFDKWKNAIKVNEGSVHEENLANTSEIENIIENDKVKRLSKDITGLKLKRSKKLSEDVNDDKTNNGLSLKQSDNNIKNNSSTVSNKSDSNNKSQTLDKSSQHHDREEETFSECEGAGPPKRRFLECLFD